MNLNLSGLLGRNPIFLRRALEAAEQEKKETEETANSTETPAEQPAPAAQSQNALDDYISSLQALIDQNINIAHEKFTPSVTETDTSNDTEEAPVEDVPADNTVENPQPPETPKLPESLEEAINSGDMKKITDELDALGISYERTKDTSKNDQVSYIIAFSYEGMKYEIPCVNKNLSYQGEELTPSTPELPESLADAIATQDFRTLITVLYDMGVTYESSPAPGMAQKYTVVSFSYEGMKYEILCENQSIEQDISTLDSSTKGYLQSIVEALEHGGKQKLKELEEMGIEYNFQENANGGYTVEFSYEGINYTATYEPVHFFINSNYTF